MRSIAIIPARSGSKGLKDKNIKLLHGKPMMAYTIEAALESGLFDCVFVSTDSQKYADIAKQHGAKSPFLRSEILSGDTASSWDAVSEALARWEELGEKFDNFALLQPTSPLRNAEDLRAADKIYREKKAKAVVSVCKAEHPLSYFNTLGEDMKMDHFLRKEQSLPRQQLPTYFRINGAIYIADVTHFRTHEMIYDSDCYAYEMDALRSVDIDTALDFRMVEFLISENIHKTGGGPRSKFSVNPPQ